MRHDLHGRGCHCPPRAVGTPICGHGGPTRLVGRCTRPATSRARHSTRKIPTRVPRPEACTRTDPLKLGYMDGRWILCCSGPDQPVRRDQLTIFSPER